MLYVLHDKNGIYLGSVGRGWRERRRHYSFRTELAAKQHKRRGTHIEKYYSLEEIKAAMDACNMKWRNEDDEGQVLLEMLLEED